MADTFGHQAATRLFIEAAYSRMREAKLPEVKDMWLNHIAHLQKKLKHMEREEAQFRMRLEALGDRYSEERLLYVQSKILE